MTEATKETVAPAPGTPEYDQAMGDKFRQSQGTVDENLLSSFVDGNDKPTDSPEAKARPEGVPEKFWDAEKGEVRVDALLKSYTELETGRSTAVDPDADPAGEPNADDPAKAAAEAAGLDWNALGQKVTATGDIETSDYEALAKAGIPKDLVQQFISLRQDAQNRATEDAYQYGGGKEVTDELLTWASKNLSTEQVEGYNAMLASPNWKVALDTLKTLKGQANPGNGEPGIILPKTPGSGGTTVGYKTEEEMRADMRNPIYFQQTPEAEVFRRQVMEKTRLAAFRQTR